MSNIDDSIQNVLYERVKAAVLDIDTAIVPDIYALSFLIGIVSDPQDLNAAVGYNTWSYYEEAKSRADNDGDAQWKLINWQHNALTVLGGGDPITETWIRSLGCFFTHQERMENFDHTYELSCKFHENFVEAMISIVRRLHTDKIIEQKFGRDLPIILCDSPFSSEPLEWTLRGNPDGQADEFEQWMKASKAEEPKRRKKEMYERLQKIKTIDWKDKDWDEMSPVELYKNFIDYLVFGWISSSGSINAVLEREDFSADESEWFQFLGGLSREQRDLIAFQLLRERESAIFDVLVQLSYRVDRGMRFTFKDEPMPVDLGGWGLHGDYIGRKDSNSPWEWPDNLSTATK
jgi:hypothetical protein